MIEKSQYKNYSLENLSEWINDALESEATVDEIYSTIVETIKERNQYHQACVNAGEQLLRKLNVATPPHSRSENVTDIKGYNRFWHDKDITGEND